MDLYDPCPCGSGKKFKWCCQPIYADIEKAFRLDEEGQHEAALQTLDRLAREQPANPEVWGRRAEMLFRNDKVEDAEAALEKAFAINPNYAYGHFLRGLFRMHEAEGQGALIEFRKAVENYDPEARALLATVLAQIGQAELTQNRPVAARAALEMAHRNAPDEDLRIGIDKMFGPESRYPQTAARLYTFRPAPAERRGAWDQALASAAGGKLGDVRKAFEDITQADAGNAPAWYNLALARAWLGDNRGAIEALDRYVALEPDEAQAADAWTLAEVLRMGRGMEAEADYIEYSYRYQIRDPRPIQEAMAEWNENRRLLVLEASQNSPVFSAMILEQVVSLAGAPSTQIPRLGAYFLIISDMVRIWNINEELLNKIRDEFVAKAGPGLADVRADKRTANFVDVMSAPLVFPIGMDPVEGQRKLEEAFGRYYEETWVDRPLKSLSGRSPRDAAADPQLRKKLRGVIQFLVECAGISQMEYDFDRLRRQLGLSSDGAAAAPAPGASLDIAGMGSAELAGLDLASLDLAQLEQAFQASSKLEDRSLAGRFAEEIVRRPADASRPDRFPWYSFLVQQAQQAGQLDVALEHVNAGEKADSEQNEGRRRNDYELRRGQLQIKRGEIAQAIEVFNRLVEGAPTELKFRGSAVEALLSARQGEPALKLAEGGLAKARELQNRDMEQYFMELVEAGKRQAK